MTVTAQLLGGLGLFLLGMWLLTEGLKLAGGNALQRILANWTVTRLRAFLSGFTLTAIVQSSSAVTVSVIGFINAGLLEFSHSLWVVFGSNVGTTMTAWIVALLGFKFKIDVLALPAVGIGAMLHLFSQRVRAKSLGGAVAGLGLLFLGLQQLQSAFAGLEQMVNIQALFTGGFSGMVMMVLIGFLLTAVMQSSSAAMALVLTAVATGVLPLNAGAAAVIGANVGTTVTALLAVLKATANARRVAVAHVLFNLITALVALLLLNVFLALVQWLQNALEMEPDAAVSLALFHTVFNLVGVVLMIPLEPHITRWLSGLFVRGEARTVKPRFLDKTLVSLPDLALKAIVLEQRRVLDKLRPLLLQPNVELERREELRQLVTAINDYALHCLQGQLAAETTLALQAAIKTNLWLSGCLDELQEIAETLPPELSEPLRDRMQQLYQAIEAIIESCYVELPKAMGRPESHTVSAGGDSSSEAATVNEEEKFAVLDDLFDEIRNYVVGIAGRREISTAEMEQLIAYLTVLRRVIRQYVRACLEGVAAARLEGMPLTTGE